MKLSELKVGDKFRAAKAVDPNEYGEVIAEPRKHPLTDDIEVAVWLSTCGYTACGADREVIPIPTHEYKVGDWVQCDSVDGVAESLREFLRVGEKYKVDSLLEHHGMLTAQMRNTKGDCDAVYYLLDRFSPTEEPKPQYKPYSDLRVLVGKVRVQVRHDGISPLHQMVTDASESYAWIGVKTRSPSDVLADWTHLDGTPCGELVVD